MSDPWSATLAVVDALDSAGIPNAIGGSLAMAALGYVRATADGDVNVFVPMDATDAAWSALAAAGLTADPSGGVVRAAERGDGEVHVDGIRVDLFFDSIPLHAEAARRTSSVTVGGRTLRFLSAPDLVVLKAMFNRAKDWVDIERLVAVLGADFDRSYCRRQLVAHVGDQDPAVAQLDGVFARR